MSDNLFLGNVGNLPSRQVSNNDVETPEEISNENKTQIQIMQEAFDSEEARELEMIDMMASKTKFATGNRELDRKNYVRFRSYIDGLLGFLDG